MTAFEDYCRRKTEAAVKAELPGFDTIVERHSSPGLVSIGNAWTRTLFDGDFLRSGVATGQARPAISLVFVESRDGNTGAEDPSTLGGGETDKHLIYEGLSRVDADAVLAGAATANACELVFPVWHPELVSLRQDLGHSRHPIQVVVTGRGELPWDDALLYTVPELRVIVMTGGAGVHRLRERFAGRPWIEVVDAGEPVSFTVACRALFERGIRTVSAIGGRRTAGGLLADGLVDDIYLTTSPVNAGEPGTPLFDGPVPAASVVLEKQGRGREAGVAFRHLRVERDQAKSSTGATHS